MYDVLIHNCLVPDFGENKFFNACVGIMGNRISYVGPYAERARVSLNADGGVVSPGLVDGHCHIESSLLPPSAYGSLVARSGTLYVVADDHEIVNVMGIKGIRLFMKDAMRSEAKIYFAVPSSVPATRFVKSYGRINASNIKKLVLNENVIAIGEMMNVNGVVEGEEPYKSIISIAKEHNLVINGHFPYNDWHLLSKYAEKGISDDHESETYDDVRQKIQAGLFVFLREGSAESVQESAYQIINAYPDKVGFCSDDKNALDLMTNGSVLHNLRKAIGLGVDPILALRAASYNTLLHYGLRQCAEITPGSLANIVILKELKACEVHKVIVNGKEVDFKGSKAHRSYKEFHGTLRVNKESIIVPPIPDRINGLCIRVNDKSLITDLIYLEEGRDSPKEDVLKLAIFSRYEKGLANACKVVGFNLKKGAMASSISHDCHNIIAVGADDFAICSAVKRLVELGGALVYFDGKRFFEVPLPLAGILSDLPVESLAIKLKEVNSAVKQNGCSLTDPFGTLSFLALEVIGHVKLTVNGLFDVDNLKFL